jgi:hypothetical protein
MVVSVATYTLITTTGREKESKEITDEYKAKLLSTH